MIVSDKGSEFTSDAILAWADKVRIEWNYIARVSRRSMPSSRASTAVCATSF
jgi:hypothetical protein